MFTQEKDNSRPFPSFSKPSIIGAFSLGEHRDYRDGLDNLKYLKIPDKINFNLNLHEKNYVPKNEDTSENMKQLATFIMRNKKKMVEKKRIKADFVCFRGLLRVLMCTPYENKENWLINCIKFKGTIYLCAEETAEKKDQKLNSTARDEKFRRFGFIFEKFILKDFNATSETRQEDPVIEAEEFCVMFEAHLNKKTVIYGAEIDGVRSNEIIKDLEMLKTCKLVEVKVKRREDNERQVQNFHKFKTRRWWNQAFLVGIEEVFAGIRDDNGIVSEIKPYQLKELARHARNHNFWHANVGMNFLDDFLEQVAIDMQNIDDCYLIFQYSYDPRRGHVSHRKITSKTFLWNEFIHFLQNL